MENRVTFVVSAAEVEDFMADMAKIKAKYPGLVILSESERRQGIRLGEKMYPFVQKVSGLMVSHPQYCPSYIDKLEFNNDMQTWNSLNAMLEANEFLRNALRDTAAVAGSEAFEVALAYYNSVKEAAKRNGGEAQTIYNSLKDYFAAKSAAKEEK